MTTTQRKPRTIFSSLADLFDRFTERGAEMPKAIEAEKSILGSAMLDKKAAEMLTVEIGEVTLETSPFYLDKHTAIYQAIKALQDSGGEIDLLTVTNAIGNTGKLESIGGPLYLMELSTDIVSTANIDSHIKIVKEKWIARETIRISEEMKMVAYTNSEDVFDIVTKGERTLSELAEVRFGARRGQFRHIYDLGSETMKMLDQIALNPGAITGIPSGITAIDDETGGWQKQCVYVTAGRPGMCKTAISLAYAKAASIDREPEKRVSTLIYSLEMGAVSLTTRILCAHAGVNMLKARKGWLNDAEWQRLMKARVDLLEAGIYIIDTTNIDISSVRQSVRHQANKLAKTSMPVGMVIVDHIGLVETESRGGEDSRTLGVGRTTRGLKAMAKEMDIAVHELSQLNREVEKRQNKRPMLSDLRESGSVEQDADVVMLLYRPEYYGITEDPITGQSNEGLLEVIGAKGRDIPPFDIKIKFIGSEQRFEEWPIDISDAEERAKRNEREVVQEEAF